MVFRRRTHMSTSFGTWKKQAAFLQVVTLGVQPACGVAQPGCVAERFPTSVWCNRKARLESRIVLSELRLSSPTRSARLPLLGRHLDCIRGPPALTWSLHEMGLLFDGQWL